MSDLNPIHFINEAIYQAAKKYPGGARGLAKAIGAQAGTFTNKCNPNVQTHVLNIQELFSIIDVTGDHAIVKEIAQHYGYVCYQIDAVDEALGDAALLDAWANWEIERGETVTAIKNALDDGSISPDEFALIRKEMFDDFQMELALLKRLESLLTPHTKST